MNTNTIPSDLWKKLEKNSLKYVVAGELKKGTPIADLIKRFRDSSVGTQIPGRSKDAAQVAYVLEAMQERA